MRCMLIALSLSIVIWIYGQEATSSDTYPAIASLPDLVFPAVTIDKHLDLSWRFDGCTKEAIEHNYFFNEGGYKCKWSRTERGLLRCHYETYHNPSAPYLSWDEVYEDNKLLFKAELYYSDDGWLKYRIVKYSSLKKYCMEVLNNNIVISAYCSNWSDYIISKENQLVSVPNDSCLVAGQSDMGIESFQDELDAKLLKSYEKDNINMSIPQPIEFGLYFPEAAKAPALDELQREGYQWENKEKRGAIGPYPDHCIKILLPTKGNLNKCRNELIAIAHKYEGIYYGWLVSIASNFKPTKRSKSA